MSKKKKRGLRTARLSSNPRCPLLLSLWQKLLNLRVRLHQYGLQAWEVDADLEVLELRKQISKEYLKYVSEGRDPIKMLMGATKQIIEKYGEYWRH